MFILAILVGCSPNLIELSDSQNYFFTTDLTADTQVTAYQSDFLIDWSGLTSDLQGHEMDPGNDIDEIRIVLFGDTPASDILEGISDNSLAQPDIDGYAFVEPEPGQTTAMLTDLSFFSTPINIETDMPLEGTYLLNALTGLYEYRMFTFFTVSESEDANTILLNKDSADLTFNVSVDDGEPFGGNGKADQVVNWMQLTTDGMDHNFSLSKIDSIMLARYNLTVSEIEDQFFDLETISEEMYNAYVEGVGEINLSTLTDKSGNTFGGFEGEGTWVLALRCSTCTNPAPLFLSVYE